MGFFAATLSLFLVLAQASMQHQKRTVQQLDAKQLQALGIVGEFLQQQHVSVPRMMGRRLQMMTAPTVGATCAAKCPTAQAVYDSLTQKMSTAMMAHSSTMMTLSSGQTNTYDAAAAVQTMQQAMPMMKDLLHVVFDDMCANKVVYSCLAANPTYCNSHGAQSHLGGAFGGLGLLSNPQAAASNYAGQLKCFCETCPASRETYVDMTVKLVSALLPALTSMGSNSGQPSSQAVQDVQKDILQSMCPLMGMTRCFDANPTECSALKSELISGGSRAGAQTTGSDPIEAIKAECQNKGISTVGIANTAASKVAVSFRLNLDFAKVNGSAAATDGIKKAVKQRILEAMKGYEEQDLTVTLKAGSVIADVEIKPMPGQTSDQVKDAAAASLTTIQNNILTDVKNAAYVDSVLNDGDTKDKLTLTATVGVAGGGSSALSGSIRSYSVAVGAMMIALLAQLRM